jgi:hypothetical protein
VARYVDVVDLSLSVEEAFDLFAEFDRTAEWDPGVVEATPLDAGPPRVGSRFQVVASFLGRRIPLEYRIVALDRPARVVLEAETDELRSYDVIDIVERNGRARVTYEARLELRGLRRLADPLLDLAFQWIGRQAVEGLRRRFGAGGDAEQEPAAPGRRSAQGAGPKASSRAGGGP